MRTPVDTIADALIAFILSLLRDPAAVEEFHDDPEAAMVARGLQDACAADVRAVAPVVIDNPGVVPKVPDGPPAPPGPPDVVNEITRIINQFTIDNRATIIDQSTNQNIWTDGGDVTQIFDQDAVVASGDQAIAAGDDASLDDSETDVTVGDVAIGNTTGSDNTTVTVDSSVSEATADAATASASAVDPGPTEPADEPAVAAPEAAPLMADLTAADGDDTTDALPPEPEDYPEEPIEED